MAEAAQKAPKNESGATPGVVEEPFRAYSFKLIIQGVTEGHFTQCSGLAVRVDTIRYREGGGTMHWLGGLPDYSPVTLKYGVTRSRELWDWINSSVNGKVQRRAVHIVMLDADGITEKQRYTLGRAFASAWSAAPLDTLTSLVAIESLEIVYETLDRD
jgi:phage tail-like protein